MKVGVCDRVSRQLEYHVRSRHFYCVIHFILSNCIGVKIYTFPVTHHCFSPDGVANDWFQLPVDLSSMSTSSSEDEGEVYLFCFLLKLV